MLNFVQVVKDNEGTGPSEGLDSEWDHKMDIFDICSSEQGKQNDTVRGLERANVDSICCGEEENVTCENLQPELYWILIDRVNFLDCFDDL